MLPLERAVGRVGVAAALRCLAAVPAGYAEALDNEARRRAGGRDANGAPDTVDERAARLERFCSP